MGSNRLSAIMIITFVVVICGAGLADAWCRENDQESCPWKAHCSRSCHQSQCKYQCDNGWKNCDGDMGNGCETDCDNDVMHCGDCHQKCEQKPHCDVQCNHGHCEKVCHQGWFDCDNNPDNGCEADCSSDVEHCGDCHTKCPQRPYSEPTCSNGHCGMKCHGNWRDCDQNQENGCERDCSQDVDNCGECGHSCPHPYDDNNAERTCSNGTCGRKCKYGCKWNSNHKKCDKSY